MRFHVLAFITQSTAILEEIIELGLNFAPKRVKGLKILC